MASRRARPQTQRRATGTAGPAAAEAAGGRRAGQRGPGGNAQRAAKDEQRPEANERRDAPGDWLAALRRAVDGLLDGLPAELRDVVAVASRRLAGNYEEDEWGRDPQFERALEPLFDFLYERWWRVEAVAVERLPATGPVLLVANHAGFLPWDALMIKTAVRREHPRPRELRFLELDWVFDTPWLSAVVRKLGGVAATPYNALTLLERGEAVIAFPEGVRAAQRRFGQRYRIQRFGRGGVVEIALRTGATLLPVAVVGSEEAHPRLADLPWLGRLLGLPTLPVTPTFPLLGPLGLVPLPARWRIEFCEPLELSRRGPEAADDRAYVFEVSERLRDTLQQRVYANLVARGPAFL